MALSFQKVSSRRVATGLCGAIAGIFLANIYAHLFLEPGSRLSIFFDVNMEKNLPATFSALMLLSCAVLLGQIAWVKLRKAELRNRIRDTKNQLFATHWRLLCGLFCIMAIDEFFSYHEKVGKLLKRHLDTEGIFYYDWVIPGSIFVVLFLVSYAKFVIHLPPATRRRFVVAGALFLGGALGMEMVSGNYVSINGPDHRLMMALLNGIEELFEMLGIVAFIRALLLYLQSDPHRKPMPAVRRRELATTGDAVAGRADVSKYR